MAMHLNKAAVDSWIERGITVHAELVKRFEASGLDPALIDIWTDDMVRNSYEDDGPSAARVVPQVHGTLPAGLEPQGL